MKLRFYGILNLICLRYLQTLKYDISLPASHYYKIVEDTR